MDGYNVKESLIIVLMGEGTYDDVKRRTVIEQQASAPDHHKRRAGRVCEPSRDLRRYR